MFFYQFSNLDDFIINDLSIKIEQEKKKLSSLYDLFSVKKENLFNITNNIVLMTNQLSDIKDNEKLDNFYHTIANLKKAFENIETLSASVKDLEKDLDIALTLYTTSCTLNLEQIKAILVEYNKKNDDILTRMYQMENEISSILNTAIALSIPTITQNIELDNITNENKMINSHFLKDNTVLVISEKDQKAYLPYEYHEVERAYKNANGKYSTIQQVIDNLYVVPLSQYKNSAMARFREAFRLMKEKEHSSIIKALDLGLELMFKSNLNPIIISACKNLDELDIYLDCLANNELFDFKCFEIKFEVAPI